MQEIIKTSVTLCGKHIELLYDPQLKCQNYRLGTRFDWLAKFADVQTALDAFEALNLVEFESITSLKLVLKKQVTIASRKRSDDFKGHAYIMSMVDLIESAMASAPKKEHDQQHVYH